MLKCVLFFLACYLLLRWLYIAYWDGTGFLFSALSVRAFIIVMICYKGSSGWDKWIKMGVCFYVGFYSS